MRSAPLTLTRSQRIRRRREFQDIYANGSRRRGRFMTIFVRPSPTGRARLGVAAPKRLGPAVVRNRAKRRARALFRGTPLVAPLDIVIAPNARLVDAPFAALETDLESLLERRSRRA